MNKWLWKLGRSFSQIEKNNLDHFGVVNKHYNFLEDNEEFFNDNNLLSWAIAGQKFQKVGK